jgi:hypothetical protein
VALRKKPSFQQEFTIFRYNKIIEDMLEDKHQLYITVYPELTSVIDFEATFYEMQAAMGKVCTLQSDFWLHLSTVMPDLNILKEQGKKIYQTSEEVENLWGKLILINPDYKAALQLYGEYL